MVAIEGDAIRLTQAATHESATREIRYEGKEYNVFRLGLGPDGFLYGCTALPLNFFRIHPGTGELTKLGQVGRGEYYSFLAIGETLLAAAYATHVPLMTYRPGRPFRPGPGPTDNPRFVSYKGQETGWRPEAMIAGPGDKVYIGAIAPYGKLGGPLAVFDPQTRAVEIFYHVVRDQSVVSLAAVGDMIVGGTTIVGGGGSSPTTKEASVFVWDPVNKQKAFEIAPVPGATKITGLVTVGRRVFGIAGGRDLFVFDPDARKVIHRARLPFSGVLYNAVAPGPGGCLYGLSPEGVFSIDPSTNAVRLEVAYRERITAGFALAGNALYFAAGAQVVRCELGQKA
jgi:hypothetical protein